MPSELRQAGKVLLVSCYELGHQPIGLAWAAAFLERAGFIPICLDTAVEPVDRTKLLQARFVGISVPMHTALRLGFRLARQVRLLNPGCHICFFGLYAALNSEYLLETVADSTIGGELEAGLVRVLINLIGEAQEDWRGISRKGAVQGSELQKLAFVVPQRTLLPPLERYVRLQSGDALSLVAHVEASRGCKHHCLHCPITPVYGGRFFVVPKEIVLEDVRRQVVGGARHVTFGDPDFLNGPGHSREVVRRIREEFPFLTFDFTAKITHLLRSGDLLREFATLGCLFVVSAAESLSDTVLINLQKGHSRADFFEALRIVRGAGLVLKPSFVSFTPWTTLDDYIDVLETVGAEDLIDCVDPIQFAVRLLIPPGSALLSSTALRPMLGALRPESFTYEWIHPDPRMDRLYREVSAIVEQGVANGEDRWETFLRISHAALSVRAHASCSRVPISVPAQRRRYPGLTEPWFC